MYARGGSSDSLILSGQKGLHTARVRDNKSRFEKGIESSGAQGLFQLCILSPQAPVQMRRESNVRCVVFIDVFAQSVRFHPDAHRNVGFVDEFQATHQSAKGFQEFVLRQSSGSRKSILMLEQFDE
jgi:hypothetical protein